MNNTFPKAKNAQTALSHIGILRFVERHSLGLSGIKIRKLIAIAVPVVAVELDNKSALRNKCVNDEFFKQHSLFCIANLHAVKDFISSNLKLVRAKCLLYGIHLKKAFLNCRVVVSACNRTVSWVSLLGTRRRQPISLSAYFADEFYFITPLPFISTSNRTEFGFFGTALWSVKDSTALFANTHFPGFSLCVSRLIAAFSRAKHMLVVRLLKLFPAPFAFADWKPTRDAFAFLRAVTASVLFFIRRAIGPLKLLPTYFANSSYFWHVYIIHDTERIVKAMVIT